MKILKKEKPSLINRLLKIGFFVLIGLMIFGAMKSCVKVKASIETLSVGAYTFDHDLRYSTLQQISTHYRSLKVISTTTNENWFTSNGIPFMGIQFELSGDSSSGYVLSIYYIQRVSVGLAYTESPTRVYFNTNVPMSGINESTWLDESWRNIIISNASVSYYYSGDLDTSLDFLNPLLTITAISVIEENAYNDGYYNGLAVGRDLGYNDGYYDAFIESSSVINQARIDGYNEGLQSSNNEYILNAYNSGYNEGYSAGRDDENPYSFTNLIFAVFEVPVKTFVGLFNWNFLGVNLANFVLSLLTLSFIVVIVKRFI